ncbi:MAG: hypothetical protein HQ580_06845 [Planctomycetes bacterium]|nr:hypothetical protein [Planctomycetota bacterium]
MNWKKGIERIVLALSVAGFFFRTGVGIYYIEEEGLESLFSGIKSFIGIWVVYWIVYYVGRYIVKGFADIDATYGKPNKGEKGEDETNKLWEKADGIIAGDIKIDKTELLDLIPKLLDNKVQTGTTGKIDSETLDKNLERISKLRAILRSPDNSN